MDPTDGKPLLRHFPGCTFRGFRFGLSLPSNFRSLPPATQQRVLQDFAVAREKFTAWYGAFCEASPGIKPPPFPSGD